MLPNSGNEISSRFQLKYLVSILVIILLIIGILIGTNLVDTPQIFKSFASELTAPKPVHIQTSSISEVNDYNHPKIFYATLEQDLKTKVTTLISSGTVQGDRIVLEESPASASASPFSYRIQVLTPQGGLVEEGWSSTHSDLIKSSDQLLGFTINLNYYPQALVKVFLKDQSLYWLGQMP